MQVGEAECLFSAMTASSSPKELKLPLRYKGQVCIFATEIIVCVFSLNNLVCGFIHIVALQVDDHFLYHRNALNVSSFFVLCSSIIILVFCYPASRQALPCRIPAVSTLICGVAVP